MTERETRILVNVSIERGYETLFDVPDELTDEICNPNTPFEKFEKYDDTPIFVALTDVERAIRRVGGYACYHVDAEELINDVLIELGYEDEKSD